MDDQAEMSARLGEYVSDARSLLTEAKGASRQVDEGDWQAACDTLSLSKYKLDSLMGEWDSAIRRFADLGIRPGG